MEKRVVIIVEGGAIQGVYSGDPAIEVIIADHDEYKEQGLDWKERSKAQDKATKGLKPLANWTLHNGQEVL